MTEQSGEIGLHRKRSRLHDGDPVEVYCEWDGDDWPCAGFLAESQAEAGGRVGGGWCGDRDCGIPEHNHKPYVADHSGRKDPDADSS